MEACPKLKKKSIKDFPEEYQEILWRLSTKNELVNNLMACQMYHDAQRKKDPSYIAPMDWSLDISRITASIPPLLAKLPEDIMSDYLMFAYHQDLMFQASVCMREMKFDEAQALWKKARELECCGKEDCCG